MKKIINGKLYDTSTAQELGQDSYSNSRDFQYWHEVLYQKRTGEYFLYGEGGPMSKYARSIGNNSWSGGEQIIPLTVASAKEWVEKHLDADDYAEIFGLPDEDAGPIRINVQLNAAVATALKNKAAENGQSVTACMESILREALL